MIGSLRCGVTSATFPFLPTARRSVGLDLSSTSEAVSVRETPAAHCEILSGAGARSNLSCLLARDGELMTEDAMLEVSPRFLIASVSSLHRFFSKVLREEYRRLEHQFKSTMKGHALDGSRLHFDHIPIDIVLQQILKHANQVVLVTCQHRL